MNLSVEAFYNGFSLDDIQKHLMNMTDEISFKKSITSRHHPSSDTLKLLKNKNEIVEIINEHINNEKIIDIEVYFTGDVTEYDEKIGDDRAIKLSMHIRILGGGDDYTFLKFSNLSNSDNNILEAFWLEKRLNSKDKYIFDFLWMAPSDYDDYDPNDPNMGIL